MQNIKGQLKRNFDKARKSVLSSLVQAFWPALPSWSTLSSPKIEEVQKVSVGSGGVLTFAENGKRYVVMARAGQHYPAVRKSTEPLYSIPGGFINLTNREGSSFVAATQPEDKKPENPRIGLAREIEEELKNADGTPLLRIDPARLKPMDMDIAMPGGQPMLVQGLMMDLIPNETELVKDHVKRLENDAVYRQAVSRWTVNPDSNLPEVDSTEIFELDDILAGKIKLLHADQKSLFQCVREHFDELDRKIQIALQQSNAPEHNSL